MLSGHSAQQHGLVSVALYKVGLVLSGQDTVCGGTQLLSPHFHQLETVLQAHLINGMLRAVRQQAFAPGQRPPVGP